MTNSEKRLIAKLGLNEEDFKPKNKEDNVTIADLLEVIGSLTELILGGGEEEDGA